MSPGGKLIDVLPDRVDTRAPVYLENREGLIAQLHALAEQLALANGGGGEKYVARHRSRGKMLARERVELLIDPPDTAFLELCPFAAWGTKFPVGGSVVVGIGIVEGVESMIIAHDPTVRGGASNPTPSEKCSGAWQSPARTGCPSSTSSSRAGRTCPRRPRSSCRGPAIQRPHPAQRAGPADTGAGIR